MQKKTIIKKIKSIFERLDETSLTTQELEMSSSPIHKDLGGRSCALIERFNRSDVDVVVYAKDEEVDEYSVDYEDLEKDVLEEIFYALEQYEIGMDKTMDRIRS